MKPIHYGALLLLGAIWGSSFLFIGVAVPEFGPLLLMFLRVLVAGLILAGLAYSQRRTKSAAPVLRWRERWRTYLIVGLLNSALPFTLIAFAELKMTVSLAAILNSTTPLFTVLAAVAWRSEALTVRKLLGVLLGVVGVGVLMGGGPLAVSAELLIAVAASLLAALCYGTATVYAAKNMKGLPAISAAIAQLLSAAIILAIPALASLPPAMPSATAIFALLALVVLSTSFAYLLYFFLLQSVGSTRTASVTFLVPVFGSIWGVLFLREPFTPAMALGMLIILSSVGLVMGISIRKRSAARSPEVTSAT